MPCLLCGMSCVLMSVRAGTHVLVCMCMHLSCHVAVVGKIDLRARTA